jgi:hypothetical protein
MFSLNDRQLEVLMTAARPLPVEKRAVFLERIAARLQLLDFRFTQSEFDDAVRVSLRGLIHPAKAERREGSTVRQVEVAR